MPRRDPSLLSHGRGAATRDDAGHLAASHHGASPPPAGGAQHVRRDGRRSGAAMAGRLPPDYASILPRVSPHDYSACYRHTLSHHDGPALPPCPCADPWPLLRDLTRMPLDVAPISLPLLPAQSKVAARGFSDLARVALHKRGLAPPTQTVSLPLRRAPRRVPCRTPR